MAYGTPALGLYLFSRTGRTVLAAPVGERLPLEPAQVEGVLALAGGFARAGEGHITHVRYDELRITGMSGDQAVVAAVSREPDGLDLVPELERFLRRCERRLRHRGLDGTRNAQREYDRLKSQGP